MESKKLFFSESHKSIGVEGLVILQYVPKPAGKWYRYGRLRGHKKSLMHVFLAVLVQTHVQ